MKFILGAQDPEMRAIEEVLIKNKIEFFYAGFDQRRSNATRANTSNCILRKQSNRDYFIEEVCQPNKDYAMVECRLKGVEPSLIIDHHQPADPGYAMPPDRYMEGSSLGQVLSYLNEPATHTHRLLCAADHCLSDAYKGLCPGVEPDELLFMRAAWKAKIFNVGLGEVMDGIMNSVKVICSSINVNTGVSEIMDPTSINDFTSEAAAYAGVPIMYQSVSDSGDIKQMFKGGSPQQIRDFMKEHRENGNKVYGNPHRGYAGSYLKRPKLKP